MPQLAYRKVPPDRMGRRFELIYISLTGLRVREIINYIGSGECTGYGEDNAFLQEIAGIIDERLRLELQRQKTAEAAAAADSAGIVYTVLRRNIETVRNVCWSSKPAEHRLLSRLAQAISDEIAREVRRRIDEAGGS